jgi:hypothetical protein
MVLTAAVLAKWVFPVQADVLTRLLDALEMPDSTFRLTGWVVAGLELGLAAWLVSGIRLRASLIVAGVLFSVFLALGFWDLAAARACGCFGSVAVPKGLILAFDATAALACGAAALTAPRRILTLSAVALAVATVALLLSLGVTAYSALRPGPADIDENPGSARALLVSTASPMPAPGTRVVLSQAGCPACGKLARAVRDGLWSDAPLLVLVAGGPEEPGKWGPHARVVEVRRVVRFWVPVPAAYRLAPDGSLRAISPDDPGYRTVTELHAR